MSTSTKVIGIVLLTAALLIAILSNSSCNDKKPPQPTPTPPKVTTPAIEHIDYTIINTFPHDETMFTEGLLFHQGKLFESSGAPEEALTAGSVVMMIDPTTWKSRKVAELDRNVYFGEGITILNDKLYQLSYKNQIGFIYNTKTWKKIGQFSYNNAEGWGMTTDGKLLIMSDGTENLTFLSPDSLKPVRQLRVTENGAPRNYLNELEYIKGYIYANIWLSNTIVKIDPATGKVVGKLDISTIHNDAQRRNPRVDVANGIAYDAATDRIFLTGKMWSNIYQVDFPH